MKATFKMLEALIECIVIKNKRKKLNINKLLNFSYFIV